MDVAATPFCNVIVGIPDSELDNPAYAPDKIDDTINAKDHNVDDYGNPVPNSPYDKYLKQCTSDGDPKSVSGGIDIIHNHPKDTSSTVYTTSDECTKNPLFSIYKFYMTIGQGENDSLTDNLGDDTGAAGGSTSSTGTGTGVYQNPFRDIPNLSAKRIDQGVDYSGDGTVYPIGSGKITRLAGPGWPGGNFIVYNLTNGPASGKNVYVAENCTPRVSLGQMVTSSTPLCTMHSAYPFIETGWAQDASSGDVAMAHDVYTESHATAFGRNFSDLLHSLGAPAGTYDHPEEKNNEVGALPAGWPSW